MNSEIDKQLKDLRHRYSEATYELMVCEAKYDALKQKYEGSGWLTNRFNRVLSWFRTYDYDFVWTLAEALMWRDEEVSIGAIPASIHDQPERQRYFRDAKYLINFVNKKYRPKTEFTIEPMYPTAKAGESFSHTFRSGNGEATTVHVSPKE